MGTEHLLQGSTEGAHQNLMHVMLINQSMQDDVQINVMNVSIYIAIYFLIT